MGSAPWALPIPAPTSCQPLPQGPAPVATPGGRGKNLEVGLLKDAGQLCGRAALLCQLRQVPQDLLHQLQVVVPNSLQLGLLQPLVGLGVRQST